MNEIERAIKTISDIYAEYLLSETDTVNLAPYDKGMQDVHTILEQALQEKQERENVRCEKKQEMCAHVAKTQPLKSSIEE